MPYMLSTPQNDLSTPYEHMQTARKEASELSTQHGVEVNIDRIVEGQTYQNQFAETVVVKASRKTVLVALPDGAFKAPAGKAPPGGIACRARVDGPPCFCQNCRAARR